MNVSNVDLFFQHITLVADQNLVNTITGMLFNVSDPIPDIVEGSFIGHVIDQQDAHGTSIVSCGDGTETFLASGIPDLQLDAFAFQFNCADFEVDADCRDERRCERIVRETK